MVQYILVISTDDCFVEKVYDTSSLYAYRVDFIGTGPIIYLINNMCYYTLYNYMFILFTMHTVYLFIMIYIFSISLCILIHNFYVTLLF